MHQQKSTTLLKKRILHISVRADIGGGPKHLKDLATTLSTHFDCYQAIAAPNDVFFESYQDIAQAVIEIPHRRFDVRKFFELRKFIQNNQIQIIHSHGRGAGIYSRLLSYVTNAKVVHTFHGIHRVKSLIGFFKDMFDRIFAHRVNHYICVSEDEKKKAEQSLYLTPDNHCSVVLNGVDAEFFRKISFPLTETYHIGCLCRFNFQKGIDLAIDCFQKFQQQLRNQNIKIHIQGDGEDFKEMQEKIQQAQLEDFVFLPGSTNEPETFFKKIHCYISFARWEGLPLSVIEAMAARRPCLISNVPGHQTFIENHIAIGFNLDRPDTFMDGLLQLISQPGISKKLCESADHYIEENLTLEIMTQKTFQVYQQVSPI